MSDPAAMPVEQFGLEEDSRGRMPASEEDDSDDRASFGLSTNEVSCDPSYDRNFDCEDEAEIPF